MLLRLFLIVTLQLQFYLAKELEQDISTEEGESGETQESSITKKLVTISKPLKLSCARAGLNTSAAEIVWFYKSCKGHICSSEDQRGEGRKVCGFDGQQSCTTKLSLERPQSGLYKCYKMEEKIGYVTSTTLVVTYDVQVLERNLEPEFIELPEDTDSFVGNNINFLCRIRSSLPLHVNWYKRVAKSQGAFQYENKFYQLMNTTETTRSKDIFVSKLKLKRVTLEDAGIYACGAINEAGIRYKEAKLIVEVVQDEDSEIPVEPLGAHWKISLIICAVVFLVIAVNCIGCLRLLGSSSTSSSSSSAADSNAKNRRRRQMPLQQGELTSDPNDTSDYEHVITL